MFNFNQNAFITEIENNIKKHKQNLKLIYFSVDSESVFKIFTVS